MNKLLFKQLFFAWILLAFLSACSGPLMPQLSTEAPGQGWKTSTPEQQGMDSTQIAKLFDAIKVSHPYVDSVLIVRNGYLVTEAYYAPFRPGASHNIVTGTESIVSILIGIAIQQGYIKGVDQKMLDFFTDRKIDHLDARKQAVTIRDLLTMTSGFAIDDGNNTTGPDDGVQYQLNLSMINDPGKVWAATRGGYTLLAAIIQKATGMTALAFANKVLFGPLGISDAVWETDAKGIEAGGNRLYLSSRDMAKIGFLYLNNGIWNGQQIVSKDFVHTSTQHQFDTDQSSGYGYGWWIAPDGSYSTEIGVDQLISVKPEQSIVTVFIGRTAEDSSIEMEMIDQIIIPAVKSSGPMPDNPAGMALLKDKIAALEKDVPRPILPLPETAKTISGQKYLLEDSEIFTLTFAGDQARLDWSLKDQAMHLPIGLDHVFRITPTDQTERLSPFGADPKTINPGYIALRGNWRTTDEFDLTMQFLNSTRRQTVVFSFAGDKVTVVQSNFDGSGTNILKFQGQVQAP